MNRDFHSCQGRKNPVSALALAIQGTQPLMGTRKCHVWLCVALRLCRTASTSLPGTTGCAQGQRPTATLPHSSSGWLLSNGCSAPALQCGGRCHALPARALCTVATPSARLYHHLTFLQGSSGTGGRMHRQSQCQDIRVGG